MILAYWKTVRDGRAEMLLLLTGPVFFIADITDQNIHYGIEPNFSLYIVTEYIDKFFNNTHEYTIYFPSIKNARDYVADISHNTELRIVSPKELNLL